MHPGAFSLSIFALLAGCSGGTSRPPTPPPSDIDVLGDMAGRWYGEWIARPDGGARGPIEFWFVVFNVGVEAFVIDANFDPRFHMRTQMAGVRLVDVPVGFIITSVDLIMTFELRGDEILGDYEFVAGPFDGESGVICLERV